MRKPIAGLTAVLVLGFTSAAYGHPSENRAERAFHGGPHCHVNVHSGDFAFPSHMRISPPARARCSTPPHALE